MSSEIGSKLLYERVSDDIQNKRSLNCRTHFGLTDIKARSLTFTYMTVATKKLRTPLILHGLVMLLTDSIFAGSGVIPDSETMCPKNETWRTAIVHFSSLTRR